MKSLKQNWIPNLESLEWHLRFDKNLNPEVVEQILTYESKNTQCNASKRVKYPNVL